MRRVKSAPANISEMVNRKKPNLENKNKNKNKIKILYQSKQLFQLFQLKKKIIQLL